MGEHRKPSYIFLLKNMSNGKTNKVELFNRTLFTDEPLPYRCQKKQYRLRVNGKWFPSGPTSKIGKVYYASWQIRDMLWKGLPI